MTKPKNQPSSRAKLTEGAVAPTLVKLTLPMLLAVLTFVAFNLVDTYFVGQLGKLELAAMGFTLPVVTLIASLSQGLSVGASAVIARAIGEGDQQAVKRLATDSIWLSFIIVATLSIVGMLTIDPVFTLLGAGPDVMPFIREYMQIWYVALAVVVIPMVGNGTIRATGDMNTPAAIMMAAVVVNIVLDPIFIFGWGPVPAMGIRGAALATLFSRLTAMVATMFVLTLREKMLTRDIPSMAVMFNSWRRILYIGVPAGGTNMLVPISTGIITGLVASYGIEAVAGYGVGSRIEFFSLATVMALSATLTPFLAQNWGAGRMDRVRLAVRYSLMYTLFWGVVLAVLLGMFAESIGGIFNDDPNVIAVLATFLLIVPFSYTLQGGVMAAAASLNALNRPLHATAIMALRLFGLYIPFALIGRQFFGLNGIFGAAAAANVVAGVMAWGWLYHILNMEDRKVPATAIKSVPAAAPGD